MYIHYYRKVKGEGEGEGEYNILSTQLNSEQRIVLCLGYSSGLRILWHFLIHGRTLTAEVTGRHR